MSFRRKQGRAARILFTPGLHASALASRRALSAAAMCEASILTIGGDLAGKRVVPVDNGADGRTTGVGAEGITVADTGLADLVIKLENVGLYPIVRGLDEYSELEQDPDGVHQRFLEASRAQCEDWTSRLAKTPDPRASQRTSRAAGLHGHLRGSRSIRNPGRTTCIDPGSESPRGLVRSPIIDFSKMGDLLNIQLLAA